MEGSRRAKEAKEKRDAGNSRETERALTEKTRRGRERKSSSEGGQERKKRRGESRRGGKMEVHEELQMRHSEGKPWREEVAVKRRGEETRG